MARALRLTHSLSRPVTIISEGPFGERVGEFLTASTGEFRLASTSEIGPAFTAADSDVVLALWRPHHGLCAAADELSFRTGTRWLPVIMEHPVIRVGPMICPPSGPCFGCYVRRRAQHDRKPWATAALEAAYESEVDGPGGYLPHQARIAAAVAYSMLGRRDLPAPEIAASEITTIRLRLGSLVTNSVLACHGCTRCGFANTKDTPDAVMRYVTRSRAARLVRGAGKDNSELAVG